MTQKDKDLLLRDLCARIPYNVRMHEIDPTNNIQLEIFLSGVTCGYNIVVKTKNKGIMCGAIEEFKPYLFPLSSMTEEQEMEYDATFDTIVYEDGRKDSVMTYKSFDWLNKNHFDYRGLIERGLALDATGLTFIN